jgi:hypothetical protein
MLMKFAFSFVSRPFSKAQFAQPGPFVYNIRDGAPNPNRPLARDRGATEPNDRVRSDGNRRGAG